MMEEPFGFVRMMLSAVQLQGLFVDSKRTFWGAHGCNDKVLPLGLTYPCLSFSFFLTFLGPLLLQGIVCQFKYFKWYKQYDIQTFDSDFDFQYSSSIFFK